MFEERKNIFISHCMKKAPFVIQTKKIGRFVYLILLLVSAGACTNDFDDLSNNKPAWLGESIYKQLEQGYTDSIGNKYKFVTYLRLIDDLEYGEVLKLTGSKTLFVADDAAFNRFYKSNSWGVTSYEGFTTAQKKLILNSSMINNAYLVELMPNIQGPVEDVALRRLTALSVLDSINFEPSGALPLNSNWDYYRAGGMYLMKDNTPITMLHFLQSQMTFKGITNEDFSIIFNGESRNHNDAHIYGNEVIVRDITCKNGYINILKDVLIPPSNMAEIIRTSPETKIFSSILERYAAPYYDAQSTASYKLLHPEFNDSIFIKRYFSERSSTPSGSNLNDRYGVAQAGYLEYDPGWNSYNLNGNGQTDMATIFVPTSETMNNFFYTGGGKFLIEKYHTIDSIPNDVLDDLIRNHMKPSFLSTLPNRFGEIMNDAKEPMGITKGDVVKSYVGSNGVVYVTDKIYAPASYVAVTAPVLINDNTRIFNWGVSSLQFDAYLLSMDSYYSFIVPFDIPNTGDIFGDGFYYVDPVSYAKTEPLIFKFKFKPPKTVTAALYKYNVATGEIGDSVRLASAAEISNRMEDLLDYHIVVGNIEDGKQYYRTKGGGEIKVDNGSVTKVWGGGNEEINKPSEVQRVYDQTKATNGSGNGKTYMVNTTLMPPYHSVYKVLSQEPQFSEFFKLLQGNDEATQDEMDKYAIFYKDKSYSGMDFNVKFFNTYHYSVYVPTNNAVQNAISKGLPTWELIKQETNQSVKDSLSRVLVNFLKYHFQDNSVYIDGISTGNTFYETAAYTLTGKKAYYKLETRLSGNSLVLHTNANSTVNVLKNNGLYNIMARDYKFNNADIQKASLIETSSWAVIHQIDDVLLYDKNIIH